MAATKLIPLIAYSTKARNVVVRLLQQSIDLNLRDSNLLSSTLSQSEARIGQGEKAIVFRERVYGFKDAREFATGW